MDTAHVMHRHFSLIAPSYRSLRTSDLEPILAIAECMVPVKRLRAADIGCGAGRYDLLLLRHLDIFHLTCIDRDESMLFQTQRYLRSHGISRFRTLKANSQEIPLEHQSMDCIVTFNAAHHMNFPRFISQCANIISRRGKVFIYTRTRRQNARSIWGRYFPMFVEKETRLYKLDEMVAWVREVGYLSLHAVKRFRYERRAPLEQLVEKACRHHYSTFALYTRDEFEQALSEFQDRIRRVFKCPDRITWFDENVLLVLSPKRTAGGAACT
ncbi:MAG: class I SAM-dependent methyltransferase [Candidatus Eisenbacteria sp.]|nr:class I SAM-dependent methyltransferase [Candidatus Eisenbacteria bacterium]